MAMLNLSRRFRKVAGVLLVTLTVINATIFLPLSARAHDGKDGGGKKVIIIVGPVTKTHDKK